jgi:hypothetical protein
MEREEGILAGFKKVCQAARARSPALLRPNVGIDLGGMAGLLPCRTGVGQRVAILAI